LHGQNGSGLNEHERGNRPHPTVIGAPSKRTYGTIHPGTAPAETRYTNAIYHDPAQGQSNPSMPYSTHYQVDNSSGYAHNVQDPHVRVAPPPARVNVGVQGAPQMQHVQAVPLNQHPPQQVPPNTPMTPHAGGPPMGPYGIPPTSPHGMPTSPYGMLTSPYAMMPVSPYGMPMSPYGMPPMSPYGMPPVSPYGPTTGWCPPSTPPAQSQSQTGRVEKTVIYY
jgi:hypothetical protein